ncbi:MAG TPA: chlorite dismutase family protein [Elusimicrobiales bacterium]|nr:chlorite dismutase family protein [Elusimicrobiales bacterium]
MDKMSKHNYSSFLFIKSDKKYKHLLKNERVDANERLANLIASIQENIFLRTYLLTGLHAECDMLIWLMAPNVDFIQETWSKIANTGAGKYFNLHKCYIGLCSLDDKVQTEEICSNDFGKLKYMVMHPVVRKREWYELSTQQQAQLYEQRKDTLKQHLGIREHFFYSYGLDTQEMIVVRESDNLEDLAAASKKLREQKIKLYTKIDTPCMLCVGTDLMNILRKLG